MYCKPSNNCPAKCKYIIACRRGLNDLDMSKNLSSYDSLTTSSNLRFDLGDEDLDFDLPLAALLIVTSWNSNFGG